MSYTPDRKGIAGYLTSDPELRECLRLRAGMALAAAQALMHKRTGAMAASGRVEDQGVQPVFRGDPRMTLAVVFDAPGAVAITFHDQPNVALEALKAAKHVAGMGS